MNDARMRVCKLDIAKVKNWQRVGDNDIFVADLVDEPTQPNAKMTVGFARLTKGETFSVSFPYDEVLVVTKGTFTVHTEDGTTVTANAGDAIYLPARSSNTHQADEDTEMAYIASPPSVYAQHVAESTSDS